MRKYLIVCISIFSLAMQAQTQVKSQPKQIAPAPTYIGKMWKINSIEEFGVVKKPSTKTKNDMLQLNAGNSFVIRMDSVEVTGKYTRSGKSLVLKTENAQMYYLTVLKDIADTLIIQCKNPDLITSTLKYTP
jgi:hypothetical protein